MPFLPIFFYNPFRAIPYPSCSLVPVNNRPPMCHHTTTNIVKQQTTHFADCPNHSHRSIIRSCKMPRKTDPWRDRPHAGQSGSTSAAFAFATEPTQQAQSSPRNNGSSANVRSNEASSVPQRRNQLPATVKATSNESVGGPPITAGSVQNQFDQLESEVIHYMNVSMEEKEKSEILSGRLETITQEKQHLERQVDELDEQLGRDGWSSQTDGASATEAGDRISRVSDKIAKLRTSAQNLETEHKAVIAISNQRAKMIAELQELLRNKKQQLIQKTQEEDRLRKELATMKETLRTEKKNYDNLMSSMKTLEQQCNGVRAWREDTNKQLVESEQTKETLSGLLKQKTGELEKFQKVAAAQAQNLHLLLDRKQKEVDSLNAAQKDLVTRCKQAEAVTLQHSKMIPQLQAQLAARPQPQPVPPHQSSPTPEQQQLSKRIKDLTDALERSQKRRVRAVGIGIDLSGSAAGSLEDGIKRVYAQLLDTLEHSPCQTYVMTVIHGPGGNARIASNFGDDWAAHKIVLEGQKAGGAEHHVECLRKIRETAMHSGLVLDLQVVLIGDCEIDPAYHTGAEEVCSLYLSSKPPVRIHSVGVKTGTQGDWKGSWGGMKAYVDTTGGNMVLWFQNDEIPDLSDLVH